MSRQTETCVYTPHDTTQDCEYADRWYPANHRRVRIASMQCPACKTGVLASTELSAGNVSAQNLFARECTHCHGHWIDGEIYLAWVERQGTNLPARQPDDVAEIPTSNEPTKARLCPNCGRFLIRAKVGHGTRFTLDRCGGCGGIWLDANEWQILAARNLHDDLHFVFSSTWQADVLRHDRLAQYEKLMISKLGPADWQEIQRIKSWLTTHPKRSELYAVLLEGAGEKQLRSE